MKLPKQVQDAADRSERAIQEAMKSRTQDPPAGDPPQDPPQPPSPSDPPTPNDPPTQQDPPKDGQDRTDWKAKYLTLQGMYNADVPRLNRELKDAQERLAALQAELSKARTPSPDQPPPTPEPATKLPAAVREALGDQVADEIEAFVANRADSAAAGVRKDIEPVREQATAAVKATEDVAADRARAARQAFMADLTRLVPDWQSIDTDERWHAYLAERDRFARRPRQELIAEAFRDGDVAAVAEFFNAYKEQAGIKPADQPPAPQPVDDKLARQQVPTPGGGTQPNREKHLWTTAEVGEVYKRRALGKISEDDFKVLEAEITAAQKEGRVR